MKFTKRITSLLLIFVFAFTSMCTFVSAADFSDVASDYAHYEAITSLVDEGIINGYEDGTFKPDNTITRAEFSKLLAVSSAPTGYIFSATTTNFPDIADMNAEHGWAVPYIAYAVSTKAINGYTDGTFQAGNPVTYGEAIKMIVCTLGYGPVADTTLTPWYQGYLNIANQIGLTKNAVALGDSPASRGIVAHLIYNMLDCPVLTQTGVDISGNPIYSTEGGSSFGESKDNATSDEGVVMGITDYSLDGTAVGRNRVQIDNQVYVLGGNLDPETVKSYIGYRVSFAYTGTGSKAEVTKITRLNGYNSLITLEPWQIDTVNENYIEYYADENAELKNAVTKSNFDAKLYVVYNGIPVDPSNINAAFINQYFNVETGSVKLFSNDGNDKTAEVVFVESYETYFVNSPVTSNGVTTIYDKNQTYTGVGALAIDEEDVASVTKVSSKGGNATASSLTAISNKSVVSVAVPYGAEAGKSKDGTSVIISSAYVTGDVNELSSDYEHIVIGTTQYELAPYYRALLANNCPEAGFTNGDNAKFYLDYLGRIVFSEKNETSDPYGLVVAYAAGSGLGSTNALKIMTTGGKFLEYNLKESMRVNGQSKTSIETIEFLKGKAVASDGSTIVLPVKYRTSGTTFTSIDTLDAADAKAYLKYSKSGPSFMSGTTAKFSMITSGTKATVVFVVPSDITNTDKYSKKSASYFQDGSSYDVVPYEMEGSASKVVLCLLSEGQVVGAQIGASTPVYLVDSINDTKSGEEFVKKLVYRNIASKDDAKEILSSDDAEVIAKFSSIKSGDLVKFVTEDGVITDIKKVFSNGALNADASIGTGTANHIKLSGEGVTDYFQAILCTINEVDDEGTRMTVIPELHANSALDGEPLITLTRSTNDVPVYEYKAVGNSDPKFELSSVAALQKYNDHKANPANASQAVVIVMNNKVVGIYLIK